MIRKIAIGLAAAAIVAAGSTLSASAAGGARASGGPAHVSVGGGSHMGGGGDYGRPAFAGRGYAMGSRAYAFAGRGNERRYDYRRPYRYGYKYRGYPSRYGSYRSYPSGSCWSRVWTPDGWRSKWICGHERPYYGYRSSYYRPYYGPRYGHYRPYYGHRYGRY